MAKKDRDLDTPFRVGEKVQTLVSVGGLPDGVKGKVRLANGLGVWRRYWVTFPGGEVLGQISHDELVRPHQFDQWQLREQQRAEAALRSQEEATAEVEAAPDGGGDGGGGIASQIPAALLERSRAAKARLLGG